jgi:hypothetical protein
MNSSGVLTLDEAVLLPAAQVTGRLADLKQWLEWGLPVSPTWALRTADWPLHKNHLSSDHSQALLQWYHRHFENEFFSLDGQGVYQGDANFVVHLEAVLKTAANSLITIEQRPQPRLSGRLYTTHPQRHDSKDLQIEVCRGALPAHPTESSQAWYTVSPQDWSVTDHHLPLTQVWFAYESDGRISHHPLISSLNSSPLNDEALSVMAQSAFKAKQQAPYHLEIEWYVHNRRWIVTQVTPLESPLLQRAALERITPILTTGRTLVAGKITAPICTDITKLTPNSILVIRQIDYHVLPLLPKLGGLVVEAHVHSPIWMRELAKFGIPSMSSAHSALIRLKPGMKVELNAREVGQALVTVK